MLRTFLALISAIVIFWLVRKAFGRIYRSQTVTEEQNRQPQWQTLYPSAVLEADMATLPQRIADAQNAIMKRIELLQKEWNSPENLALWNALRGLGVLRGCAGQRSEMSIADLNYTYPHLGCGGTMVPTQYGWACNKCLHRMVDYSRRSASEKDEPLEDPWLPCDCPRCKGAKRKTHQDPPPKPSS